MKGEGMIQRFFRSTTEARTDGEPRAVRAEYQVVAVFLAGLFFGFALGLKVASHDETRVVAAGLRSGWGELPESRELLLAVTEMDAEVEDEGGNNPLAMEDQLDAEEQHTGGGE